MLFSAKGKKIEDDLLDKSFDFLEVVNQPCRTEDQCRMIDCEIAEQYRWYYPKRASLIVDMINEGQRE